MIDRPPPRSYLYAPGHRADVLEKALAGEADVVVADLEDAVPAADKARARETVVGLLREGAGGRLHVRVNPVPGPTGAEDLRALADAGPVTVRLPKVHAPAGVAAAAELVGTQAGVRLSCLLESAAGVEHAFAIATAHPSVAAIALGEADLRADLGVTADAADAGLLYARSRCVVAARAAALPRPAQSVFPVLGDDEALARTTRAGRAMGFFGRSAIHPSQVAIINEVSLPSAAEVADAEALVAAMAGEDGHAVLPDGRYVDEAVVQSARSILAWAPRETA